MPQFPTTARRVGWSARVPWTASWVRERAVRRYTFRSSAPRERWKRGDSRSVLGFWQRFGETRGSRFFCDFFRCSKADSSPPFHFYIRAQIKRQQRRPAASKPRRVLARLPTRCTLRDVRSCGARYCSHPVGVLLARFHRRERSGRSNMFFPRKSIRIPPARNASLAPTTRRPAALGRYSFRHRRMTTN